MKSHNASNFPFKEHRCAEAAENEGRNESEPSRQGFLCLKVPTAARFGTVENSYQANTRPMFSNSRKDLDSRTFLELNS